MIAVARSGNSNLQNYIGKVRRSGRPVPADESAEDTIRRLIGYGP